MPDTEEMRVDPSRAQALISQLTSVKGRVSAAAKGRQVKEPRVKMQVASLHDVDFRIR